MTIKASINISLSPEKSCILSLQKDEGTITTLVYSDTNKSVTFDKRDEVTQTKDEIIEYLNHFTNFNSTILNHFPNVGKYKLEGQKIQWRMEHKPQPNQFEYEFLRDNKTVLEIKADLTNQKLIIIKRTQPITLSYLEFDLYLKLFRFFVRQLPF